MIILTIIIILVLSGIIASILVNIPDYKTYKEVYYKLDEINFKTCIDLIVSDDIYHNIIWFTDKNDFKLSNNVYIHNDFILTYLDPYTLYWFIKYKRWFKNNPKIKELYSKINDQSYSYTKSN